MSLAIFERQAGKIRFKQEERNQIIGDIGKLADEKLGVTNICPNLQLSFLLPFLIAILEIKAKSLKLFLVKGYCLLGLVIQFLIKDFAKKLKTGLSLKRLGFLS